MSASPIVVFYHSRPADLESVFEIVSVAKGLLRLSNKVIENAVRLFPACRQMLKKKLLSSGNALPTTAMPSGC